MDKLVGMILRWCFLFFAVTVNAADLCVSVSGSGSQSGVDWDNTLAQTFTPARGNTYYIADGTYSGKTWTISRSGSNYITIKKAIAASHGPETGWVGAYGDGVAEFGDIWIRSSEFIFDGQIRTGLSSGHGFKVNSGTVSVGDNFGLEVTNVTVRYTEVAGSDDPMTDEDNFASVGNKRNITVQYCYFHDPGNSNMQLNGSQNVIIEHSLLQRNQGEMAAHSEIIVATGCDDLTVRYNVIDEAASTAAFATPTGGHPQCAGDDNSNWYIYGNVFRGPSTVGGGTIYIFDCTITGDFYVVNNTFCGISNSRVATESGGTSDGCITTFTVRNNLYVNADQGISSNNVTTPVITHNAFWSSAGAVSGSSAYVTTGDPLVDYVNYDFDLDASSASGMDAGVSIANIGNHTFDVDSNGLTRGGDGKWDRGAFEFQSSPPITSTSRIPLNIRLRP